MLRLMVAHDVLEEDEANGLFGQAYRRLEHSSPRFCLLYALTELLKHRRHPERALEAARLGLGKAPDAGERRRLRAAELFAQVFLTGETPSVEQLYLAGLSELAVHVKQGDDVTQLLLNDVLRAA